MANSPARSCIKAGLPTVEKRGGRDDKMTRKGRPSRPAEWVYPKEKHSASPIMGPANDEIILGCPRRDEYCAAKQF